ncbi:MAG: hypothetical protein ACD_2C00097G0011 [uncultured bacterium (gcode 4)]|uniref:PrgI family protein n=1 Tax=uncultured bacterium (gcode 4) TaxID=1234023 RepID=K2G3I4_9BACT|nr:MAG: hypothetical protein ACD_2C00097G0011 [uncultured bacterium (gcode 4)]
MQYKIPVQIENEDKIFLNLSLRQIMILMIGFSVAYTLFKSLEKSVWWAIALFPTVIIGLITFIIAVFKHTEMTFVPFLLNLIRLQLNAWLRVWSKWVESYWRVEVWYVPPEDSIQEKMHSKVTKNIHEDILSKI